MCGHGANRLERSLAQIGAGGVFLFFFFFFSSPFCRSPFSDFYPFVLVLRVRENGENLRRVVVGAGAVYIFCLFGVLDAHTYINRSTATA